MSIEYCSFEYTGVFTACDEEDQQDLFVSESSTTKADFLMDSSTENRTAVRRNSETIFQLLDKDQDDKISSEEVENALRKKMSENFDRVDNNQDGFIDKEELMSLPRNR